MRKMISMIVLFAFGFSHTGFCSVRPAVTASKNTVQAKEKKTPLKEPRLRKKSVFDAKKTGLVAAGIAAVAVGTVVLVGKSGKEEQPSGKLPGPPDWPE